MDVVTAYYVINAFLLLYYVACFLLIYLNFNNEFIRLRHPSLVLLCIVCAFAVTFTTTRSMTVFAIDFPYPCIVRSIIGHLFGPLRPFIYLYRTTHLVFINHVNHIRYLISIGKNTKEIRQEMTIFTQLAIKMHAPGYRERHVNRRGKKTNANVLELIIQETNMTQGASTVDHRLSAVSSRSQSRKSMTSFNQNDLSHHSSLFISNNSLVTMMFYVLAVEFLAFVLSSLYKHDNLLSSSCVPANMICLQILQGILVVITPVFLYILKDVKDSLALKAEIFWSEIFGNVFYICYLAYGFFGDPIGTPIPFYNLGASFFYALSLVTSTFVTVAAPFIKMWLTKMNSNKISMKKDTFELMLQNPIQFEAFKEVLASQYCLENALFYQAYNELLKKQNDLAKDVKSTEIISKMVVKVVESFVASGSPYELNIPWNIRDNVCNALQEKGRLLKPDILKNVYEEVLVMMYSNTYPRYIAKIGESVK